MQLKKCEDDNKCDVDLIKHMKIRQEGAIIIHHKGKIYFIANYIQIYDIKTGRTICHQFKPSGSYDPTKSDKYFEYFSAALLDGYDVLACLQFCGRKEDKKKARIDLIYIGEDGFDLKWNPTQIKVPLGGENGNLMVLVDRERPDFAVHGFVKSIWKHNEEFREMLVPPHYLIELILEFFGRKENELFWISRKNYKKGGL